MSDYKKTLHLPKTKFPMKANLSQKEPEMLKEWESKKAYDAMLAASGENGEYVLHDGPPYANGHLHLGHALNKVLKDIIIKSQNMQGKRAPYIPGWDCHGLPIELKVEQQLGDKKKTIPEHVFRKVCREYAEKFVGIQRKEFKRLGVLGEWEKPYLTMHPSYEAATARELGRFMEKGSVARSKKPIYWCASCKTALAEAEVEYDDHVSPSIYVRFPMNDARVKEVFPKADPAKTFAIIWTTTPWTIPDNMAIALHPELEYSLVDVNGDFYLLASALVEENAKTFGWEGYAVVGTTTGEQLEGIIAKHPIYDREAPICLGDHVTTESGTGCVHTAPGHGREDFEVGQKYGLEIYSPMDDEARFLDSVEFFAGLTITEANPKVIEKLEEVGNLLKQSKVKHSYPHCWRCKKPVIFRATTQWFITMEANDLRKRSLEAIRNDVKWIPTWGEERIYNMVENRPDWCISRQRMWGVPIIALLCKSCDEAWYDTDWVKSIVEKFAAHKTGCDYWFESDIADLVPEGLACPKCGGHHWKRSKDILDVWFDSGTSFAAVVEQRPELSFPADMYLEGSDQHRGWFHSSLLASMGTRGCPPYKEVLTHGYVVDGNGKKMSKSVGNGIEPEEVIKKYGAEILRMWASSVEYREDIRISEEILSRLVDAYRRIRNTSRYLLGNISDLTADALVPFEEMEPLDRYAVDLVCRAHERIQAAYTEYEFHKVYHTLHNLCTTDLSSFYLDILKDRLYSSAENSKERRSAQTAMLHIVTLLVRNMAPVLSFTAEEVFKYIPEGLKPEVETVFALSSKDLQLFSISDEERANWETMLQVRSEMTKAIEPVRKEGIVGHPLDTHITLYMAAPIAEKLEALKTDLRSNFIVSQLSTAALEDAPADAFASDIVEGLKITVAKAEGEKCERCWIYSNELGSNSEHPTICPRCTNVLQTTE
ncbi:isoleucine--tRNA ligase [Halodesulfovibrio sp. MK-HDV]|jgi:isoleucyl-tRNA synthetase|uniref:isoleucine--tRNA ligase n=1 Tax=unclassified Halodesulfovibrio TaxID=2644657 RepID=UPI00136E1EB6|nr:isoleucine--tRNA ligase [Halodesulfovibrio sp. MK-HDV]KAF1077679.1 Isoleucine--tRNA ligase [Halodesulfovibrio sp. MK-HDV]